MAAGQTTLLPPPPPPPPFPHRHNGLPILFILILFAAEHTHTHGPKHGQRHSEGNANWPHADAARRLLPNNEGAAP